MIESEEKLIANWLIEKQEILNKLSYLSNFENIELITFVAHISKRNNLFADGVFNNAINILMYDIKYSLEEIKHMIALHIKTGMPIDRIVKNILTPAMQLISLKIKI